MKEDDKLFIKVAVGLVLYTIFLYFFMGWMIDKAKTLPKAVPQVEQPLRGSIP